MGFESGPVDLEERFNNGSKQRQATPASAVPER